MNKYSIKPMHLGISVPDIDDSLVWYQDMLGFQAISDKYLENLNARVAFMKLDDFYLEFFQVENAKALPADRMIPDEDIKTHGNKHIAFSVTGLEKMVEELKNKGADIAMDVFEMEGELVAFVRDNSGNLLEFIERKAS